MSNNPAEYEVLIKQYLHPILDISVDSGQDAQMSSETPVASHANHHVWLETPMKILQVRQFGLSRIRCSFGHFAVY